jgi:hypothetical protein
MRFALPLACLTAVLVLVCGARPAVAQIDGGAPDANDDATVADSSDAAVTGVGDVGPDGGAVENTAPAANGTPTRPVVLSGYVRGDVFVGKVAGASRATTKAAYGEASLALRTAKIPHADGFAEARVRTGLQGDQQTTFLDLREAYVNAYAGPVDLRLGQQIIVWGRADALNPTNNLTPVDFRIRSPIEDDIRLGNVGARGFLRLAPFRLEGVWMPIYLPTLLPPVGLPPFVSEGPTAIPAPELANGLYAGRLHLELPAVEMSLSYLRGYAPLPGLKMSSLTLTGTANPPPSIVVARTPYRHQVVGFDFSTALGDWLTIRGEAAYRRPEDDARRGYVPRADLQYVLGIDHNFGALSVIAQYLGRYVFDWQKENAPGLLDPATLPTLGPSYTDLVTDTVNAVLAKTNQILFQQTARVQHVGTLRAEWLGAHDTLSLSALAIVNVTTHEWLVTPRIGYRVDDALAIYLGAQIFHGPHDTLFGLIDAELSAGYAELRYIF